MKNEVQSFFFPPYNSRTSERRGLALRIAVPTTLDDDCQGPLFPVSLTLGGLVLGLSLGMRFGESINVIVPE